MRALFYVSLLLFTFFLFNCTTQQKKEEVRLRQVPQLLEKSNVDTLLEKQDHSYDIFSPDRESKEKSDDKFKERLSNLTPIKEMFEGLEARKFQLEKQEKAEQKAIIFDNLKNDVDLREFAPSIKRQWNGTCSAFGLIATEEVAHCIQRKDCGLDLSERHFWSFYKQYSAPKALEMSTNWVTLEGNWPQDRVSKPVTADNLATHRVSKYEYLGGDSEKAKLKVLSALSNGHPVYMWSQTPSCMLSCAKTCNSTSKSFEDGGHAYSIVGYFNKENPTLIVKNSWGEDCGDLGYQYISFKIWDNASYWEAASIIEVESKTDPNSPSEPVPPKYITKCEYRWYWTHFWTKRKYCWEEEL